MVHRGSVTGLGVLLSALALAAGAAGEEVYVGTVTVPADAKPAAVALTLTIREYTSDDRVLELAQLLHKSGHAAAIAEMAKTEAGTVRLGDGSSFRACSIRQEKNDKGRLLRVVTDRPMQVGGAGSVPPKGEAVGYLELQLGASGEGSGRLLPVVKVTFDAEGFLAPENLGAEWPVASVKPGK